MYLLKFADKDDKFGFKDELERSQCLQWLFFWHGSGAPYQGQTNHFLKAAPEKIKCKNMSICPARIFTPVTSDADILIFHLDAIDRFHNETLRVYGVLEIQLSGKFTDSPRDYLAGEGKGKYSVADIGTWPWVKGWRNTGFTDDEMKEFPHLLKWVDRIAERPAVKRGIGEAYQMKK